MRPSAPLSIVDATAESNREWNAAYARNTCVANLLGLCALTVPCGCTQAGLPIGLMITGKARAEDMVLRVGLAYERATAWHERRPDLAWAGETA